ncbi:hypothetical protein ACJX0J_042202, partial [Zea mays]
VQDVLLLLGGRELSSLGGASSSTPYSKDRMRRHGQYGEVDINSMVVAQLHHYQAQQRVQKHPENSYTGRDPAQASVEHQYTPPKGMFGYTNPEGDWRGLNPLIVKND